MVKVSEMCSAFRQGVKLVGKVRLHWPEAGSRRSTHTHTPTQGQHTHPPSQDQRPDEESGRDVRARFTRVRQVRHSNFLLIRNNRISLVYNGSKLSRAS